MICKPCRDAADRLTAGLNAVATSTTLMTLYGAAREAHKACLGATSCDCQHKVERHGIGVKR